MTYNLLPAAQNIVAAILPILILVGIVAVPILLIWLLIRPLRLWYWQVDRRNDSLDDINRQIYDLKNDIKRQKHERQGEEKTMQQSKQDNDGSKGAMNANTKETANYIIDSKQDGMEEKNKLYSRNRNVDKNGKVYKREELEAQIKL